MKSTSGGVQLFVHLVLGVCVLTRPYIAFKRHILPQVLLSVFVLVLTCVLHLLLTITVITVVNCAWRSNGKNKSSHQMCSRAFECTVFAGQLNCSVINMCCASLWR